MLHLYFFFLCLKFHVSQETVNEFSDESYTATFRKNNLHGDITAVFKGHNRFSCAMMCSRRDSCKMAILDEKNSTCILTSNAQGVLGVSQPQDEAANGRYLYIQMLGTFTPLKEVKNKVYRSCKSLKRKYPSAPSGMYWIDPTSQGKLKKKLQLFCNQELDKGGWALVWTYKFTDYNNFMSFDNAITPLPTWSNLKYCSSPASSTPPQDEEQVGAVPYRLWAKLGEKFLIKSNIMNWISCSPGVGSLVNEYSGSIHCRIVRQLTSSCTEVPRWIGYKFLPCGVVLRIRPPRPGEKPPKPGHKPPKPGQGGKRCGGKYIAFDGSRKRGWPIHDACGTCLPNHLKGVAKPRVNVYLRA